MKIFNKLLILAVIAALAGPFILKGPDGMPLMSWRDFLPKGSVDSINSTINSVTQNKMYKWKDEKGRWQFGDNPPEGVSAVEMAVKTQINEMKTIELPEGFKDEADRNKSKRFDPGEESATPFSTAPLTQVPEMLDQIKDFQNTLDERKEKLDDL